MLGERPRPRLRLEAMRRAARCEALPYTPGSPSDTGQGSGDEGSDWPAGRDDRSHYSSLALASSFYSSLNLLVHILAGFCALLRLLFVGLRPLVRVQLRFQSKNGSSAKISTRSA
jgi:hypothetical protein